MKFLTARCKGNFAALLGCLTRSGPVGWCATLGTLLRRSFHLIRLPNKSSHALFSMAARVESHMLTDVHIQSLLKVLK